MQGTGRKITKRTEDGFRVAEYSKGNYDVLVQGDTADLTAVNDMNITAMQALRKRGYQESKYPPDRQGLEAFYERATQYFQEINRRNADPDMSRKIIGDVEGLCIFLGISRVTLKTYYDTRNDEWRTAIDFVKTAIASGKKQLALTYRIPPMFAVFDLINSHGYKNTSEFKVSASAEQNANVYRGDSIEDIALRHNIEMPEKPEL